MLTHHLHKCCQYNQYHLCKCRQLQVTSPAQTLYIISGTCCRQIVELCQIWAILQKNSSKKNKNTILCIVQCWRSSMVEPWFCKPVVVGSSPIASSTELNKPSFGLVFLYLDKLRHGLLYGILGYIQPTCCTRFSKGFALMPCVYVFAGLAYMVKG